MGSRRRRPRNQGLPRILSERVDSRTHLVTHSRKVGHPERLPNRRVSAHGSRRCRRGANPAHRRHAGGPAPGDAADRRHRPGTTAPAAASRSSPNRTRTPAAGAPTRPRCAAQTGLHAGTTGLESASAQDASKARPATAARSTPTAHRRQSKVCSPSQETSKSPTRVTSIHAPQCVRGS